MDRKHHIDAPSNESLRTIEQIDDRSGLTTIYPRAKKEWEGSEILSREEREKKLNDEKLRLSMSLRKWFLTIGVLIPLPLVVIAIVVAVSAEHFDLPKLGFLLLPLMIITGAIIYASYRAFRYAYSLFYKHGSWGLTFLIALFGLLGLSLHAIFLFTAPIHNGSLTNDSLIVSGGVLLASIMYSGLLVLIWTSPRLSSKTKIILVGVMMVAVLAGTSLFYVPW